MIGGASWFAKKTRAAQLDQGDFVPSCPTYAIVESVDGVPEIDTLQVDAVILTQTCDMVSKVAGRVLLCPVLALGDYHYDWRETKKAENKEPSKNNWTSHLTDLKRGKDLSYLLIQEKETVRVALLRYAFHIERFHLDSLRRQVKFQLKPPYRELLSQRYAGLFSRIGTPEYQLPEEAFSLYQAAPREGLDV
jgi:hypothetical protein